MPDDLSALMGAEMAREGLARLGGSPAGMIRAEARDSAAAVGLLESTLYLRNQLLRDSDWASMGNSLELRTPLVDAQLLETLGPYTAEFTDGAGKAMLARSPQIFLSDAIVGRPKTGFGVPMAKWLVDTTVQRPLAGLGSVSAPGTPWARQWARRVIEELAACKQSDPAGASK
jgi:asparagine synthase (glutamine-hydrolysing)